MTNSTRDGETEHEDEIRMRREDDMKPAEAALIEVPDRRFFLRPQYLHQSGDEYP